MKSPVELNEIIKTKPNMLFCKTIKLGYQINSSSTPSNPLDKYI